MRNAAETAAVTAKMQEVETRLKEMVEEVRGYSRLFGAEPAYCNKQEEFAIELRKAWGHLDEARRLCFHVTPYAAHLRLNEEPAPILQAAE